MGLGVERERSGLGSGVRGERRVKDGSALRLVAAHLADNFNGVDFGCNFLIRLENHS